MQWIKWFLLFFMIRFSSIWSAPYLIAEIHQSGYGMFSIFNYVAGVLHEYDTHDYAGIEIDFGENSLYYDPIYGPNWWEYYCEPIRIGNKENSTIKRTQAKYANYTKFTRNQTREYVHYLIEKYIRFKDHITQKLEQFTHDYFTGYHIIGIHYRGTDKISEAPRVPYERVTECIQEYLTLNNLQNYKIFVASDEKQFIDYMEESYPGLILVYSTIHSEDGTPLHFRSSDQYLHGEEALLDCLLLSRTDLLIRTSSNLSLWSTNFNPNLPVIELSTRYTGHH